jgi:hypothetical protein
MEKIWESGDMDRRFKILSKRLYGIHHLRRLLLLLRLLHDHHHLRNHHLRRLLLLLHLLHDHHHLRNHHLRSLLPPLPLFHHLLDSRQPIPNTRLADRRYSPRHFTRHTLGTIQKSPDTRSADGQYNALARRITRRRYEVSGPGGPRYGYLKIVNEESGAVHRRAPFRTSAFQSYTTAQWLSFGAFYGFDWGPGTAIRRMKNDDLVMLGLPKTHIGF